MDQAQAGADAGFDYVEENVQNFLAPQEPDEVFARKLAALPGAGLPVMAANCFLPGALKCTGPSVEMEALKRYAETAFQRARQAGIRFIVFGSGGARQIPEGFDRARARDQFLACLRGIAPLAEREGVTLVVEPLNKKECNFINSLAEGAGIVEEAGHPQVRLLADIYHMRMDGEPAAEIVAHGRWLKHVHVAEREGRFAPGTQGEDFGPYLRALKEIEFAGAISYECGWKNFPGQAVTSVKGFREQVRRAGLS
jgi:sugar phosphate isomerase/epimerase